MAEVRNTGQTLSEGSAPERPSDAIEAPVGPLRRWGGPGLRLGSYGWAYAAQLALTLVLGVDAFAIYVAATALGMLGAYGSMAGVSDLLIRQWPWLASRSRNLAATLSRFVAPRLALAFVVPAVLAIVLEQQGLIRPSGATDFWLLVGSFGLLTVTVDLCGVLLACLGRPSFHVITSNGLLGTSFFGAAGWALFGGGRPDAVMFHIGSQTIALAIIATWVAVLLRRTLKENEGVEAVVTKRPDLRMGVTVTAVHVLEIFRAHLPVLLIQAAFQSATASALVASMRFSRAADVMSVLAVAQYTRDIVSGTIAQARASHRKAQRLCLALTVVAMVPIGGVVAILCLRQAVEPGTIVFLVAMILLSAVIRQITAIEIWMAKVVNDPGPALRVGLMVEGVRFAAFAAVAATGHLLAAMAVLVASDALLLAAMLRVSQKARAND